jgi:zinc/manganese transport system substrate-binding protein
VLKLTFQFWLGALVGTALFAAPPPAQIVASFSIVDDWTHVLVGQAIRHQALVPAGSELHGFQLGANEAKALSAAQLIVGLSPASEPWLAEWVKAHRREASTLWLQSEEKDGAAGDPHPWTDPSLVMGFITKLGAAIQGKFTDVNTQDNVNQYLVKVKVLDAELREAFAALPSDRRKLITQHPNLGRLAQRYHLQIVGTILESPSAEAADPSARHYSRLLGLIRAEKIRVLVTDEGQNEGIARRLCQDARLPPPLALNFETLAPAGQPGDDWLGMMRRQTGKLREALSRR